MKKLAGFVLVLAVLVLGGYYGMGVVTEKTIKRNIEVINQSNGLFAEIEQYNRGWYTSDAKIKWRMHVPERIVKDANGQSQTVAGQDYQMEMPVKIYHGPIIYAHNKLRFGMGYAESDIAFPDTYAALFDENFTQDSIKPQLDLSIFVNYLNKSTIGLSLPSFKLISKDGKGQFDWMGMESTTFLSPGMEKVKGDLVVDGMKFEKDTTKVVLGKMFWDFDLHKTSAGLFLGDATFTLPSFIVTDKDQKIFELSELAANSDSDIDQSLFNMHFTLSLKSVVANGKSYGPGDFEIAVRNLDADVLARINQQANKMQSGSDAERQQAMLAMLPELPKLFSKGAELEISKLSVKLPQGSIEGNLFVGLPKGETTNPFELIQKVKGNASLKVPSAVVKQLMQQNVMQQMANQPEMQQALIQQLQSNQNQQSTTPPTAEQLAGMQADKQLASLEQTGLILVKGEDYSIEVGLEQGKFTVNGKPFDPSMMKF